MGWSRFGAMLAAAMLPLLAPSTASAERVVFVNLEPTVLIDTAGQDPSMNSYATTGFTAGPISGWPELDAAQQAELLYLLYEATVPFDITFTTERPAAGNYDMVVTGTQPDVEALFPGLGCSASIGLADCDDTNVENVSFLFYGCMTAEQQTDMSRVAYQALVGLGFGWGLENLTGSGQVMAGYSVFGLQFGDACSTIQGVSACVHAGCAMGEQNSTTDVTAAVGARVDDGPPEVVVLQPADQTIVPGGAAVTIEAEITDKFGGLSAELEVVEAKLTQEKEDPPFSWEVNLPEGAAVWTLRISGTDADGNVTTEEVQVCVDMESCDGSGGSTGIVVGTTTSGGTSDGDADTTAAEPEPGSSEDTAAEADTGPIDPSAPIDPSFDLGPASSGCHCRSGGGARWAWLALFGLIALRRRR